MSRPSTSRYVSYHMAPRATTTLQPSQLQNAFVFAPRYRKADKVADAATFQARARAFCSHFGFTSPYIFDNDGDDDNLADGRFPVVRRRAIIEELDRRPGPINVVAYFGHGLRRGLSSAGFLGDHGLQEFADALARNINPRSVIILNACSCGHPGGFAEQLGPALVSRGVRATIYAHNNSGHTTNNPTKRRYPGGDYLIAPGDKRFRSWRQALWGTDLWARYPFMEPEQIAREV